MSDNANANDLSDAMASDAYAVALHITLSDVRHLCHLVLSDTSRLTLPMSDTKTIHDDVRHLTQPLRWQCQTSDVRRYSVSLCRQTMSMSDD